MKLFLFPRNVCKAIGRSRRRDGGEAPEITIDSAGVPGKTVTVKEDGSHLFANGDIKVFDSDAEELDMVLTLSVEYGTLSVNRSGLPIHVDKHRLFRRQAQHHHHRRPVC